MRKNANESLPAETPKADDATLVNEYELLKPIIYFGKEVNPPAKVSLNDQQAERLRNTGHIV